MLKQFCADCQAELPEKELIEIEDNQTLEVVWLCKDCFEPMEEWDDASYTIFEWV